MDPFPSLNLTSTIIPDFFTCVCDCEMPVPPTPCPVPAVDEFSPLYMICAVISGIGIGVIGTYLFNFFFIKKRCEKNDAQPHFQLNP